MKRMLGFFSGMTILHGSTTVGNYILGNRSTDAP
jgi:hypothetical protein